MGRRLNRHLRRPCASSGQGSGGVFPPTGGRHQSASRPHQSWRKRLGWQLAARRARFQDRLHAGGQGTEYLDQVLADK
jgi:hypothetical protein